MRLAKHSNSIFEEFFCETALCEEGNFPEIRVYVGFGAKFLTGLLLVDGITLGKAVYVSPRWARRSGDGRLIVSKQLLAHEFVHVFQYRNEGSIRFLIKYVMDFLKEFRKTKRWTIRAWFEAYQSIPHEVEARKYAGEFKEWLKARNN